MVINCTPKTMTQINQSSLFKKRMIIYVFVLIYANLYAKKPLEVNIGECHHEPGNAKQSLENA